MATVSRFDWDYASMGNYLRSSASLQAAVLLYAEGIAKAARAIAPVGNKGDPHPGAFRDSIHAEAARINGRVGAKVIADSEDALWAEFGRRDSQRPGKNGRRFTSKATKGSHTLRRVGKAANMPKGRIA